MNEFEEKLNLILRTNQLSLRDKEFANGDDIERAKVIDQQITDILNPKREPSLRERTSEFFEEEKE